MRKLYSLLIVLFIVITGACNAQDTAAFKPSGKVWGLAFGDYFWKQHSDSFPASPTQYSGGTNDSNAFDFRRIFLGFDYNLSEKFSARIVLAHEGTQVSNDANRTVFIKTAYLQWKNIFKRSNLFIGLSETPQWIFTSEKMWDYRSIEKDAFDMRLLGKSFDLGVALRGSFNETETFGYHVMIGNGSGTKEETDKFKKFSGDIWTWVGNKKVFIDYYADYERTDLSPLQSRLTHKITVAYQAHAFTIGISAGEQLQKNYVSFKADTVSATAANVSNSRPFLISVFTHGYMIPDKLKFFARYDNFNSDENYNASYQYLSGGQPTTEFFVTAGFDWMAAKNFHIMPNIWYNEHHNRNDAEMTAAQKRDYDLVPRITFYYVYN